MEKEINIFTRHTRRSDGTSGLRKGLESSEGPSKKWPSVTNFGENKARETARKEYQEIIEMMDRDGILFLGGSSEEARTKATAEIIGEELGSIYSNNENVLVIDSGKIKEIREKSEESGGKAVDEIKKLIERNPNKKIVIIFPMFLKEFSLRPAFKDKKTGELTEYTKELLSEVKNDDKQGAIVWLSNKGELIKDGKILSSVSPQEMAGGHTMGIGRLREFAHKIIGERQLNLGLVGHGWNLDALAIFYANGGRVSREAFKKLLNDENIDQAETGWVEVSKSGAMKFHYKGKELES